MDVGSVLETWRQVLTVDFLRYFLAATPFYFVFWRWRPGCLRQRRLQSGDPERDQILSEIAYSLSTIVIFSAIGLSLVYAQRAGLTRVYVDVGERGWAYLAASVAIAIGVHDAYFYWTHRLLHWRPLYRIAHHVHHRSTSPTPWAAYAFHPLEAVIQAGVYLLVVFGIPMHPLALTLFRGNYGLYFSFWDEWVGTSRSDYAAAFDLVTARPCRPTAGTAGDSVRARQTEMGLPVTSTR